ncbi:MAG TPA: glycosyltransferase family 87 protein, partial [Candidatus Hodarchaeales archaeon]|nr:glycosyltransferase family 87 protein [Candidatus Hodarchaeales archaeon]
MFKVVLLGLLTVLLVHQIVALTDNPKLPVNDFVEYWAASRLLLEKQNPYAPDLVFLAERAVGWPADFPQMMWNPPWTLSYVLPFGAVDFKLGQVMWLTMNLFCIFLSAHFLWYCYEGSLKKVWIAWILAISFAPSLISLKVGQICPLMLLGVAGFLVCLRHQRDFVAGTLTVLVSFKPHLLYLFWIVLLLWILHEKRWKV